MAARLRHLRGRRGPVRADRGVRILRRAALLLPAADRRVHPQPRRRPRPAALLHPRGPCAGGLRRSRGLPADARRAARSRCGARAGGRRAALLPRPRLRGLQRLHPRARAPRVQLRRARAHDLRRPHAGPGRRAGARPGPGLQGGHDRRGPLAGARRRGGRRPARDPAPGAADRRRRGGGGRRGADRRGRPRRPGADHRGAGALPPAAHRAAPLRRRRLRPGPSGLDAHRHRALAARGPRLRRARRRERARDLRSRARTSCAASPI